jgi:hypothetical protein
MERLRRKNMHHALKHWAKAAVPVAAAIALIAGVTGVAMAHEDDDYDVPRHEWHGGWHDDWHSGPHAGWHSGVHWSPEYGWHYGNHYGLHSGRHHDWHYGGHHDWYGGEED